MDGHLKLDKCITNQAIIPCSVNILTPRNMGKKMRRTIDNMFH